MEHNFFVKIYITKTQSTVSTHNFLELDQLNSMFKFTNVALWDCSKLISLCTPFFFFLMASKIFFFFLKKNLKIKFHLKLSITCIMKVLQSINRCYNKWNLLPSSCYFVIKFSAAHVVIFCCTNSTLFHSFTHCVLAFLCISYYTV